MKIPNNQFKGKKMFHNLKAAGFNFLVYSVQ